MTGSRPSCPRERDAGFRRYLIEAGNGVLGSVVFCDTAEYPVQSTRVASNWMRQVHLHTMGAHAGLSSGAGTE